METIKPVSHPLTPAITQPKANTTLWIGHLHTDPTEHFAGQTFKCSNEGMIDNIKLFSSAVHNPGQMQLTLHEFDDNSKQWGPSIANSSIMLEKGDDEKWIEFKLQSVPLHKGYTYGFRVYTNDAFIGIGEAASGSKHPFTTGQSWAADSNDRQGHFFNYFSLAFRVEMRA